MVKTKYFKYSLILLIVVNFCIAQQKLIDSLQNRVYKMDTSDKNFVLFNAELAEGIRYADNVKSINLIKKILPEIENNDDYKIKAKLYWIVSSIYKSSGDYSKMIDFAEKSILCANKSNDIDCKAQAYFNKGLCLNILDDEKKINALFEALKYAEKAKNYIVISKCYYFIAGVYFGLKDLVLHEKYAKLAVKFAIKSKNPEALTFAWDVMGSSFAYSSFETKNKRSIDSATYCFQNGIKIFQKNQKSIVKQDQLGYLLLNNANHYYMNVVPRQNDSIKKYANLALIDGIKNEAGTVETSCYGLLSQLAFENNDLNEVERLLKKGLLSVENRKYSKTPVLLLAGIYFNLSELYKRKGDYKQALLYNEKSFAVYEKSINEKQIKTTQILDAKYELRKKTEQIKLLDEKNKLATKQKYLYFAIFVALLLSLLFMFLSYNYRLKFSIQKEKLSESNAKLKTEEAARLLVEQDLILVQKQQMQKELLAGALQVDHKNDLIKNMKQKLVSENLDSKVLQKMNRIINEESRLDNQFNEVKNEFKDIHPDFFKKLQENSKTKLSSLDLKYCAYIKLNLPTKQMATLLNVEPSTIRMNKYRLKQKLELAKEEDLFDYLNQIS